LPMDCGRLFRKQEAIQQRWYYKILFILNVMVLYNA
jgi:hypothetical protein